MHRTAWRRGDLKEPIPCLTALRLPEGELPEGQEKPLWRAAPSGLRNDGNGSIPAGTNEAAAA